ncbi:MAG: 16S rRNA (cytosine(1402)-N(4))-methyltransferase RsmH [Ruminococcaceae bacterium]|nr:16S rRNA (cytosine(1402)-N(4))-methyltransferase RsmH [Oscillospiraceae bacterium]
MEFSHVSVLLKETVDSLDVEKGGIYVDCTCGGAGHSREILNRLEGTGRLIAIDQDPDAIEIIKERIGGEKNVTVVHDNFSSLRHILDSLGIERVDGVMADLGVSSHQLDKAERGFSLHNDAPLDMRMSKTGLSAYDVVNTYGEKDLVRIFRIYGEEKFAPRIAKNIVNARSTKPVETTLELAELIKEAIPAATRRTGGHPARRCFQAIRLEVNGELEKLESTIGDMFSCLNKDGRLSIITFHSLEDRIVKKAFQEFCKGCECPKSAPICICGKTPEGELVFRKLLPGEDEIERNPRSRSATLRSIKKLR